MKKHLFNISIIAVFFIGLSVMLYPTVASYFNSLSQSRVVAQYYRNLESLSPADYTELIEAAHTYNSALRRDAGRYTFSEEDQQAYLGLLNPFGNGIMGTLIIDTIGVKLPIYHGTSEGVLQVGAGHFEGTSLPVGGPSTHAVITGHRGLPSSTLLTNMDRLVVGDTFVLRILNDVLTYKIDQILVVEPHEVDALDIEPGMDYCTLVTCTPYGINSHRMLVRGRRTTNTPEERAAALRPPAEATIINNAQVTLALLSPALVVLPIYLFIKHRKLYGRRKDR